MPNEDRKRVTLEEFSSGDVFIDYPYEDARFRWELATGKVYRYFLGDAEFEIDPTSNLYHEAISGGWKISREDYFRGPGAPAREDSEQSTTAETDATRTCCVCGLAPGEVSESAVGPMSYPRCQTCLEEQAESIAVICLRIYLEGGPETFKDSYQGNWWPFGVKSYSNGEYISWPRILALYPRFEALFEPY